MHARRPSLPILNAPGSRPVEPPMRRNCPPFPDCPQVVDGPSEYAAPPPRRPYQHRAASFAVEGYSGHQTMPGCTAAFDPIRTSGAALNLFQPEQSLARHAMLVPWRATAGTKFAVGGLVRPQSKPKSKLFTRPYMPSFLTALNEPSR